MGRVLPEPSIAQGANVRICWGCWGCWAGLSRWWHRFQDSELLVLVSGWVGLRGGGCFRIRALRFRQRFGVRDGRWQDLLALGSHEQPSAHHTSVSNGSSSGSVQLVLGVQSLLAAD